MADYRQKIQDFRSKANSVLIGKEEAIDKCLCCIFAGGHILIEDIPGVGKTTLVKLVARLLGLTTNRTQCTNDHLPSDIIGGSIIDKKTGGFVFQKGPIFSQILIADELNRATPRTQSACLQAMEEGEVSVDGTTYTLPSPFIIVATQNPQESIGTFPLPESQLDRFLMKISVGHPSREAEREILEGKNASISDLSPIMTDEDILNIRNEVSKVSVSHDVMDYLQEIISHSRTIATGLSTRAALDLIQGVKAWAYLKGRDYVIPDDAKALLKDIAVHRLGSQDPSSSPQKLVTTLLEQVAAP